MRGLRRRPHLGRRPAGVVRGRPAPYGDGNAATKRIRMDIIMKLNEILGTEFPIIQGGMANIATGEFAAAVSNAGAMGLIGGGGMSVTDV